jgi:hypothetical protein
MSLALNQAENRVIYVLFVVILMCCLLFFSCSVFSTAKAAPSVQFSLGSHGNINYDFSSSSPISDSRTNLASIPVDWTDTGHGISDYDNIVYPSDLHDGVASIRVTKDLSGSNLANEVNCRWIKVYAGDLVVMRCWIKTTNNTAAYDNSGARIAFDYFSETGRINGPGSAEEAQEGIAWNLDEKYSEENQANFVPWGQTEWIFREWNVSIPEYAIGDGWLARPGDTPIGMQDTISGIIPWMQVSGAGVEQNAGYFADFELYIYRNGTWL